METCKFSFITIKWLISIVKINTSSVRLTHRCYRNCPCNSLFIYCNDKINCVSFLILLPLSFVHKVRLCLSWKFLHFFSPSLDPPMEGTVYLTYWKAEFWHPFILTLLCGGINVLKVMGIVRVELRPLKRYVEVLTPGTCECDLIWKLSLCRCNQVKMRSLVWALIQYD